MKTATLPAKFTKSDVTNRYGRIAPVYDLWGELTESKARQKCLDVAGIQDGEDIIEVAVGTGLMFEQILHQNPSGKNVGIDLTEEMLAKAQEKAATTAATNYDLRVGDAYNLPFADASFDLLVNNYMFDLLPETDFEHVLREFRRVLRPGGRLVMANMAQGERWYNGIWEMVYRIQPAWLGGCRGIALLDQVQQAGFSATKREFISQMTFPSEIICGVKE